ncbi:hypothetical protein FOXYSP1_11276 [Fusarium oxysporum f. sp. phaseoli]
MPRPRLTTLFTPKKRWLEMTRKLIRAKSESGFSRYRPAPTCREIILYGPTTCYAVLRFFKRYKRAVGCWLYDRSNLSRNI